MGLTCIDLATYDELMLLFEDKLDYYVLLARAKSDGRIERANEIRRRIRSGN